MQFVADINRTRSKLAAWKFGQLAAFFFALMFILPSLEHGLLVKSITTLFVLNSLLVADSSSPEARSLRWAGWTLWVIATSSNIIEEMRLPDSLTFTTKCITHVSHTVLFLFCAASILTVAFRAGRVTLDGIFASIVAYQLVGLCFAQVYTLAMLVDPTSLLLPDSAPGSTENFRVEMIYFSFVTMATLGYGDIVPDTNFTRTVTIFEAIVGQFYVAVVVAVLVSAFVAQRLQDDADDAHENPTDPIEERNMVNVVQVGSDTRSDDIVGILKRDGAVVVKDVFDRAKRDAIEAELRPYIERPEAMHTPNEMYEALQLDEAFLAANTKRAVGLVTKSPTFREQVMHPITLAACDAILKPNCSKYQLQATAAFVIGPGAKRQVLHREEDGYPFFELPRPDMVIASMLAISDFTFANGATRLVPGSHRWPKERAPTADEITAGEMPAGSLLLWMGGTLHGAGPNTTNEWRFGTFASYSLGWLRQEENHYLNVPPDVARTLAPELRRIVGYQIVDPSLGFADTNADLLA